MLGLDPAQPAFDLAGPNGRLDKGDAELVDIIHTNSGMLWEVSRLPDVCYPDVCDLNACDQDVCDHVFVTKTFVTWTFVAMLILLFTIVIHQCFTQNVDETLPLLSILFLNCKRI